MESQSEGEHTLSNRHIFIIHPSRGAEPLKMAMHDHFIIPHFTHMYVSKLPQIHEVASNNLKLASRKLNDGIIHKDGIINFG